MSVQELNFCPPTGPNPPTDPNPPTGTSPNWPSPKAKISELPVHRKILNNFFVSLINFINNLVPFSKKCKKKKIGKCQTNHVSKNLFYKTLFWKTKFINFNGAMNLSFFWVYSSIWEFLHIQSANALFWRVLNKTNLHNGSDDPKWFKIYAVENICYSSMLLLFNKLKIKS